MNGCCDIKKDVSEYVSFYSVIIGRNEFLIIRVTRTTYVIIDEDISTHLFSVFIVTKLVSDAHQNVRAVSLNYLHTSTVSSVQIFPIPVAGFE